MGFADGFLFTIHQIFVRIHFGSWQMKIKKEYICIPQLR